MEMICCNLENHEQPYLTCTDVNWEEEIKKIVTHPLQYFFLASDEEYQLANKNIEDYLTRKKPIEDWLGPAALLTTVIFLPAGMPSEMKEFTIACYHYDIPAVWKGWICCYTRRGEELSRQVQVSAILTENIKLHLKARVQN